MEAYEERMRRGDFAAFEQIDRFFARDDPVHRTLRSTARTLKELQISYAVIGGMALVAHGYNRVTVDIDILLSAEGLRTLREQSDKQNLIWESPRQARCTENGVKLDFLVAGQFPGDGKPKPVAFPDPDSGGFDKEGVHYIGLPTLVELKLASGVTNPGRLKDLGDVQELIRTLKLQKDFSAQLNPYVREKYEELWTGVQNDKISD